MKAFLPIVFRLAVIALFMLSPRPTSVEVYLDKEAIVQMCNGMKTPVDKSGPR